MVKNYRKIGELILNKKTKAIEFDTKIFYKNKVYLPVDDARKALGLKTQNDFIQSYGYMVTKIKGAGNCISETDYNDLLSRNKDALSKQEYLEITKVDTLRSKINMTISMYPLKFIFGKDYFEAMARQYGCTSAEDYIYKYDLPQEKKKCLEEISHLEEENTGYRKDVQLLKDKSKIDISKLKQCGLEIRHITTIECTGRMKLRSYIVGVGVFHEFSEFDYQEWDRISVNENGNIILPYYNYDSPDSEERLIDLSESIVDRDFRNYSIVENIIWCIENLKVVALEDYEYGVFSLDDDTIKFDVPADLMAKIIRPDSISTFFVDGIVEYNEKLYLTEYANKKIFSK